MIDIAKPFSKTTALLKQLTIDESFLDQIELLKENEAYEAINSLHNLEKKKEEYKNKIIDNYSIDYIIDVERCYVKNMISSFENNEDEFSDQILELNPFAEFYNSKFIFLVQDGKNIIYTKRDTDYIFIPKFMATGSLRIDDIALGGGLNFLLSIKKYDKPFSINSLLATNNSLDVSLLIDKIKRLMLYQSIVVKTD